MLSPHDPHEAAACCNRKYTIRYALPLTSTLSNHRNVSILAAASRVDTSRPTLSSCQVLQYHTERVKFWLRPLTVACPSPRQLAVRR